MLIVGLSVLALVSDPRPPRPSDEAMLAALVERIPGAVVLESYDRPMASEQDGAKGICGIALINDQRQPFFVFTLWRPAGAELGNRWSTAVRAARSSESRMADNFERLAVRTACPELTAPEGVEWPTVLPSEPGVVVESTDRLDAEGRVIR